MIGRADIGCRVAPRLAERECEVCNVSVRGARSESCMVLFVLQFM